LSSSKNCKGLENKKEFELTGKNKVNNLNALFKTEITPAIVIVKIKIFQLK